MAESLKLNELLFTHAGYTTDASAFAIDWSACSWDGPYRFITFKYVPTASRSFNIKFLPFTQSLKVRHPIKLSSKAKLRSRIKVNNYEVIAGLDDNLMQIRRVTYEEPTDYRLYITSREQVIPTQLKTGVIYPYEAEVLEPEELYFDNFTYLENDIVDSDNQSLSTNVMTKVIGGLPTQRGYVFEILKPIFQEGNYIVSTSALAKLVLPDIRSGLLAASTVDFDMLAKSPTSIAWGLLNACALSNDYYVVMTLKALVNEAFHRGYLYKEAGAIIINPNAYWGFESTFIPQATQDDSLRDISDNAFLGWALCIAIRYLQDRLPLEAYSLEGGYGQFQESLSQLLLSIGYLCAYSISPISWWCSQRFEGGAFNYEAISQQASYLTSIFLNELLQIQYDQFIHSQSARLFLAINNAPSDPLDSYYSIYNDASDDDVLVGRALWCWKFDQPYEDQLSQVTPIGVVDNLDEDVSVAQTLAVYLYTTLLEVPNWVTTYLEDYRRHALGDSLCSGAVVYEKVVPVLLAERYFSLKSSEVFNLYAHEAEAKVTGVLQELRRLWPTGMRWGSAEVVNRVTSVLGSLFYAQAQLYFDYYLVYFLTRAARAFDQAQGDFARQWASLFLPTQGLYSDAFLRNWCYYYLNREYTTKDDLESQLNTVWGYFQGGIHYKAPRPFALLKDLDALNGSYSGYTEEDNTFNSLNLNTVQLRSVLYKPADTLDLSDERFSIDSDDLITSNGGFIRRQMAGFPYRTVLLSDGSFNCSDTLALNEEYNSMPTTEHLMYPQGMLVSDLSIYDCSWDYWYNDDLYVIDESVLIKPLVEYVPQLEVSLRGRSSPLLHQFITTSVADGISYVVTAENHYANPITPDYVLPLTLLEE